MKSKKRTKKKTKRLIAVLGCLLCVAIIFLAVMINQKNKENASETSEKEGALETQQEQLIEKPEIIYQNEDIEIYTIFPSSVVNIDSESEYVTDLSTIEFKNISGKYLKKCEFQITANNGETYEFVAEDIPKDMQVMAFDTSSKTTTAEVEIDDVECNVEKGIKDALMKDTLEIVENGMDITIKNISEEDLTNLVVTCHCVLDELSYGGSKYEYSLEKLGAGETATINAEDCYFGDVKVVRVVAE